MSKLTHFNEAGHAQMVDVSAKNSTHRIAIARGRITMKPDTLSLILAGGHKKGDVLATARLAGIMAAKKTPDLVPLCHPVMLSHISVDLVAEPGKPAIICTARAEANDRTGVEMEALTAVQIALLTVYDMCKAVDRGMVMGDVQLVSKSGGKSGQWQSGDL